MSSILHARQASPTTVYFFNERCHTRQQRHCYHSIHRSPTEKCSARCLIWWVMVIIPISNAASERAFSMVRKIETDFRSELAHNPNPAQDTTCSLLSTKMNSDVRPSLFVPSVQVLRAAKRATLDYNTTHSAAAK